MLFGFDLWLSLRSERSSHSVRDFWVSNSGFFRSSGLIVFFGFGLLLLRNEQSLLGKFWVCSNSGFVRNFGLFVFFGFGLVLFYDFHSDK